MARRSTRQSVKARKVSALAPAAIDIAKLERDNRKAAKARRQRELAIPSTSPETGTTQSPLRPYTTEPPSSQPPDSTSGGPEVPGTEPEPVTPAQPSEPGSDATVTQSEATDSNTTSTSTTGGGGSTSGATTIGPTQTDATIASGPASGSGIGQEQSTDAGKSGPTTDTAKSKASGSSPEQNPCDDFKSRLASWKAMASDVAAPNSAPRLEEALVDEMISRAIAAVTDAISRNGSTGDRATQFALIDPDTLGQLHEDANYTGNGFGRSTPSTTQLVARPGNEAFIVRTDGSNNRTHNSLYYLQRLADNQFQLKSYDSANGNFHRTNNQANATEFIGHLDRLQWKRSGIPAPQINATVVGSDPPARQAPSKLNCGVYVILYAWAMALGLDISNFQSIPPPRLSQFNVDAVDLITLALQGCCDSATIEAFLKCYGVVRREDSVPVGREFGSTTRFLQLNDLRRHIALLRLEHDVPPVVGLSIEAALSQFAKSNPNYMNVIWTVGEGDVITACLNVAPEPTGYDEDAAMAAAIAASMEGGPSASGDLVASTGDKRSLEVEHVGDDSASPKRARGDDAVSAPSGSQVESIDPVSTETSVPESVSEPPGQYASPALSLPPITSPAYMPLSSAGVTTAEPVSTSGEAPLEVGTPSEGSLLTNLLDAIDHAPSLTRSSSSNTSVVTTVITTEVDMDPLDMEARETEQAAIQQATNLAEDDDSMSFSENDDLFGEDSTFAPLPVPSAAPTAVMVSDSPIRQLASINTTATGLTSPGLALPPPTPRNTASSVGFLPGLGPLTSTPTTVEADGIWKRQLDFADSAGSQKRVKSEDKEGDEGTADDEGSGSDLM